MRIIISIALLFTFNGIQAQWVDVGLKGGAGTSLFFNQNLFDDQSFNHNIQMAFTVGGKIGYNFNDNHQVTFDVMYQQQSHEFDYSVQNPLSMQSMSGKRNYNLSGIDYLLMYRYNNEASYFEVGPQLSVYSNKEVFDTGSLQAERNNNNLLSDNTFGLALGFGSYVIGTENFGITTGVRFNYMLSDIVSPAGKDQNLPGIIPYENYRSTNIFTAMFVIEMNYDLGYLASANCGKRRKIMFF